MARKRLQTLQQSGQFRTCYAHGRKVVCDHAVIFYHTVRGNESGLQVGVVASKRVGNAVRRNRAKRLLREAARHVADRLNDRNLWVVLVAKSSIVERSAADVRRDIERGLAKAGIL